MARADKSIGAADPGRDTDARGADAEWTPEPERLISDAESLKALSDPTRLRILEMMVSRPGAAWSVKELAGALGVPQTRLYHHVELLLHRDLIRAVEQRVVSGIIETRYRVAALAFRLDHRLLSGDSDLHAAGRDLLHMVFDAARDDVARSLHEFLREHAGDDDMIRSHPERPILHRGLARLTPERGAEFRARLMDLIHEFDTDEPAPGAEPWGFLAALYRLPAAAGESSDD